jgi:hypothetical protein
MSGRDVRRLAARAGTMTHEAKRDVVARIAAGADAVGATDLFIAAEPYRIASGALEQMPLRARVQLLRLPLTHSARDTEAQVEAFYEAGCRTFVSLGGDGTNRAIVRALGARAGSVCLIPLSTGTNNVFPVLAEPTIAGMVAGLVAGGHIDRAAVGARTKVLHLTGTSREGAVADVGLIDAVLLRNDHVGNLLPFDTAKIAELFLSRAEPDGIGMSPIGGLVEPVGAAEDAGLWLRLGAGRTFRAPVSPGLFAPVAVAEWLRRRLGEPVTLAGPGVVAVDGDRDHTLEAAHAIQVTLRRDGPWVPALDAAMRLAVSRGKIRPALAEPRTQC